MTPSPRERAAVLRETGLTYDEIARYLAVSRNTVYRWLNPDYEEHQRAISLAWKDRNRERKRAHDREHMRKPCPVCGRDMMRHSEMCQGCRSAIAGVRRTVTEGMWAQGWPIREIAEVLGVGTTYFAPMRARGWDLPLRYRMENGRRVAA